MSPANARDEPTRASAAPERVAVEKGLPIRYRIAWLIAILAAGSVYLGLTKSGWAQFQWNRDLDGYYDLLGRAFLSGHLQLPLEPRQELLSLPDPYDARFNQPYRVLDLVLYHRHYYLYQGAAPALLFFAPWRLLTGHDLPESFAVFAFCLAGYIVLCELLMLVLRTLPQRVPVWMFTLLLLTLGLGESVPYLLQRAMFYEIALTSGFLFIGCAFFCLWKSLTSVRRSAAWLCLCGLCFGLSAGCRPQLVLAMLPAFVIVVRARRDRPVLSAARAEPRFRALLNRKVTALVAPAAICGICIAGYNYARFGNPLEFGLHYMMANPGYQNIRPALVNIFPGLYYFLFCAPAVEPVFPFLRIVLTVPLESLGYHLPARYFNEGTSGIVVLCPLVLFAAVLPLLARKRSGHPAYAMAGALAAGSLLCLFFVASLGLESQRYEIDFQPYLLLAACISAALVFASMRGRKRWWAGIGITLMVGWSIFANMLLAIQGPYDQFVQAHTEAYLRLAQWFSPVERHRPLLNPPVHLYAYFYFSDPCSLGAQPLISISEFSMRYLLSEVCTQDGRLRITSAWGDARVPQMQLADVPLEHAGFERIDLEFSPQDRVAVTSWNGKVILRHALPFLFTARSQVRMGWDDVFGRKTEFSGRFIVPAAAAP